MLNPGALFYKGTKTSAGVSLLLHEWACEHLQVQLV